MSEVHRKFRQQKQWSFQVTPSYLLKDIPCWFTSNCLMSRGRRWDHMNRTYNYITIANMYIYRVLYIYIYDYIITYNYICMRISGILMYFIYYISAIQISLSYILAVPPSLSSSNRASLAESTPWGTGISWWTWVCVLREKYCSLW